MSDTAIRVRGIGKMYRIGGPQERYGTLRDSLVHAAKLPVRAVRNLFSGDSRSKEKHHIWALQDVSMDIGHGEVVGFIGHNGAGKSTLLKILSRITEPTVGYAELSGRVGSLLEVGTGFHPELTGRENIYLNGAILGMKRAEIDRKFDEMVAFAEVEQFIDTPVKHYSSGMYLRMAFAVAAHLDPEILLVDEVLAVGDAAFQRKCLAKMREVAKAGQTVIFVSHNLEAILNLCTRCLILKKGGVAFDGAPPQAVTAYHKMISSSVEVLEDGVIFQEAASAARKPARVTMIETLDACGDRNAVVSTWDDVVFRIHYAAEQDISSGSIVLDIRDYKDQRLIVLDSGLNVAIRRGETYVDCVVKKLPLPAGEYYVTIGVSQSNALWVWRQINVGLLRVLGKDVYGLNRAPVYSRMAMVVDCDWAPAEACSGVFSGMAQSAP